MAKTAKKTRKRPNWRTGVEPLAWMGLAKGEDGWIIGVGTGHIFISMSQPIESKRLARLQMRRLARMFPSSSPIEDSLRRQEKILRLILDEIKNHPSNQPRD